ncbi:hypothetical protein SEA_MISHA28_79 [Mycobacterium phage Misha28]|nr:hypothetical protein SEA_MISHA28_79 [Mycobacterium phage Misha28]AVP42466.1 hypothetical protein SEA_TOOTSIEPOP_79 [Mycobacterium phage TootsiePop]QKO03262.1 hypothetical protein SEA_AWESOMESAUCE_79 [Mycobacterium phage Awesomesauce]
MSNPADKLLQRARAADLLRSKGLLTDKEMADVIHEAVHKAMNPKEVDSDDGGAEPMIPRDKVAEAISRQAEWEAVSIPYPKIERMAGAAIGAHMEALSETGHAVVKLAETQTDPEFGDEFWQVPSSDSRYPGKLRIETGYRDGVPRISMTSIRTPMPITEVDAYVSALLAAKAFIESEES